MRSFPFTALTLMLLASMFTYSRGAVAAGDSTRSAGTQVKGVNLSGKVSSDAKTLLTDDDNDWRVANPDALKGREGRYVTVRCRMDLSKRAIQVFSLVEDPGVTHTANLGDSAFRR